MRAFLAFLLLSGVAHAQLQEIRPRLPRGTLDPNVMQLHTDLVAKVKKASADPVLQSFDFVLVPKMTKREASEGCAKGPMASADRAVVNSYLAGKADSFEGLDSWVPKPIRGRATFRDGDAGTLTLQSPFQSTNGILEAAKDGLRLHVAEVLGAAKGEDRSAKHFAQVVGTMKVNGLPKAGTALPFEGMLRLSVSGPCTVTFSFGPETMITFEEIKKTRSGKPAGKTPEAPTPEKPAPAPAPAKPVAPKPFTKEAAKEPPNPSKNTGCRTTAGAPESYLPFLLTLWYLRRRQGRGGRVA